jgi:hypothetical protein
MQTVVTNTHSGVPKGGGGWGVGGGGGAAGPHEHPPGTPLIFKDIDIVLVLFAGTTVFLFKF